MNQATPLYEISNLHYTYTVENKRQSCLETYELVLDQLAIQRGRMTAILGPSGCGKTTLLSLLGLLRKPQRGNITVFPNTQKPYKLKELWRNADHISAFRHRYLGFAMQRGELFPFLTIEENVGLPLRMTYMEPQLQKERVDIVLKSLYDQEEERIFTQKSGQVSQGQFQRAAVARAMITRPDILLADEPTGNLDVHNAKVVLDTLHHYAHVIHKSVILVTHDLKNALTYADDIFVLNQSGRLAGLFPRDMANRANCVTTAMGLHSEA